MYYQHCTICLYKYKINKELIAKSMFIFFYNGWNFNIYKQDTCRCMLSWLWKKFYSLEAKTETYFNRKSNIVMDVNMT